MVDAYFTSPLPPIFMNYWLISDTHFNHLKLEEWGGREGDWQARLWKGLVHIPAGNTLIHLGDVCIGEDQLIHSQIAALQCRKVLVIGNHDRKSKAWYTDHGWDFVCDSFELIHRGHYIYFSHRPQPPMGHFTMNVHGHTHGNMHRSEEYLSFYDPTYHKDISPELVGYQPLSLDSVLKK
jgi:calcineurin-like phosphoesterase family protein